VNGNSARIAAAFCRAAEEKGAEVTSYILNTMRIKGCQGCLACKRDHEKCVVKDDLTPVFEEFYTTDILVFSTPIYVGDVTGQLKCCFDRMYSLAAPNLTASRLPKGKKLVFIQTQGADASSHRDVAERYLGIFKFFIEDTSLIRACSLLGEEDVEKQPWILSEAEALANRLVV
jgi:multimeric flavodoxin WrbA